MNTIEELRLLLETIGVNEDALVTVLTSEELKEFDINELFDALQEENSFVYEFIYLADAQKYILFHDPDLSDSLKLAYELGFDVIHLDIYTLATILYEEETISAFWAQRERIESLLQKIKEEA